MLSVSVAASNALFASSGGDRSVFIWDVARALTTRRFSGHGAGAINAVAWGGEADSVVVSGGFDKKVHVWDYKAQGSSRPMMTLDEATDAVSCLVVRSGHGQIIAGSVDGRVRAYDLRMGMVCVDVVGREWARFLSASPFTPHQLRVEFVWCDWRVAFEEVARG